MYSYAQIARWLSFPIDPISVEDFLANREIFGPSQERNLPQEEKELELAYLVEQAREQRLNVATKELPIGVILNGLEKTGLNDESDFLIIAPGGVPKNEKDGLEVLIVHSESNSEKLEIEGLTVKIIKGNSKEKFKVKVKCKGSLSFDGNKEAIWEGTKKSVVFDTRGRPLRLATGEKQKEIMGKLFQVSAS